MKDLEFEVIDNIQEEPETIKVCVSPNEVLKKVNGASNSRFPVQFSEPGKEEKKGFFTAAIYTDAGRQMQMASDKFIDELRKNNQLQPEWLDIFELTLDYCKQNIRKELLVDEEGEIEKPFERYGIDDEKSRELKNNKEFMTIYRNYITRVKSPGITVMDQYTDDDGLAVEEGESIDKRNVAMYKMSLLLGTDTIPYTTHMQIKVGDKITEGTFMETAPGVSAMTVHPDDIKSGITAESFTGKALRDIADIQILDYICMNLDRHSGNFVFELDKSDPPKIIGVKGIDNDFSFGTRDIKANDDNGILLQNIHVISERMADYVMKLDLNVMRSEMKSQDMTDAVIASTEKRIKALQNSIKEEKIQRVSDEEWDKKNLTELYGGEKNTFKFVNSFVNTSGKIKPDVDYGPKKDFEYAKSVAVQNFSEEETKKADLLLLEEESELDLIHEIKSENLKEKAYTGFDDKHLMDEAYKYIKRIKSDLNKADSIFFKSSDEYKLMKKSVESFYDTVKSLENRVDHNYELNDKDIRSLQAGFKNFQTCAESYIDMKTEQIKREKRDKTYVEENRLTAAKNVRTVGKYINALIKREYEMDSQLANPEKALADKITEVQNKIKNADPASEGFRKDIATLIYLNGVRRSVSALENANKIVPALSPKQTKKHRDEILKMEEFDKLIADTPKERLIELASKQQGRGLFTQYVKIIAKKKLADGLKPKGRKPKTDNPQMKKQQI